MISVMALSASALIVGLRPAVQPITVRAAVIGEQGFGVALPGSETLADQYRNRWSGDTGEVGSTRPQTVGDASSGAFSGAALSDVVCIVDDDGEEICGPGLLQHPKPSPRVPK